MEDNLKWKEIKTEHIVQDEWIDFRRSVYRYPDGRIFEPFYSYSRRNYTVVVASDENGRLLCVRQFRQGIRQVTTEFPAGGIERIKGEENGSSEYAEEALDAAKRELAEETGYVSDDWEYLLKIPSNATLADNYAFVFRARNCRKECEQNLDETELLDIKMLSAVEIETLIHSGEFQQAVHVMAWLLSKETKQGSERNTENETIQKKSSVL